MEKGDERKGRENEKRSNDNKNKNKKCALRARDQVNLQLALLY